MSIRNIDRTRLYDKKGQLDIRTDFWVRKTDWLPLVVDPATDHKFVGLFAVRNRDINAVAFTAAGNYTVDWGDGTSDNFASGATAQKTYNFADISSSTLTSEGFKQVIITITPQSGQNLTTVNLNIKHSTLSSQTTPGCNWLEVKVGGPSFGSFGYLGGTTALGSNGNIIFPLLENFEVYNGSLSGNNLNYSFNTGCPRLNQFTFISRTDFLGNVSTNQMLSTFCNCFELTKVDIRTPSGYIEPYQMDATFYNCYELKSLSLIRTNQLRNNSNYIFNNCFELEELGGIELTFASVSSSLSFSNTSKVKRLKINQNSNGAININGCNFLDYYELIFNAGGQVSVSSINLKQAFVRMNTTSINGNNMFQFCTKLIKVIFSGSGSFDRLSAAFQNCYDLKSVEGLRTNGTNIMAFNNAFSGCYSLESVPSISYGIIGGTGTFLNMFNNCYSLKTIGAPLVQPTITSMNNSGMFQNCISLTEIPAIRVPDSGGSPSIYTGCLNLTRTQAYGLLVSTTLMSTKLDAEALNEVINNLGIPTASRTLTITGSLGAILTPAYSRSSTTTTGSTTITLSDTSNLVIGGQVTGTGINDGRAVTFQGTPDTVTLAGHGIPNGKLVSFTAITTTTGIAVYTPYYVVNATTDTFQLSLTAGGSAIALTNDGSGTMIYQTLITAIDPNVSVTIDVPASISATNTLSYRNMNTQLAVMKRWTITG